MPSIVTIRDLCKSFAGVRALDKAQFDLQPGEVHALMGENGAGKSTLMKVLAGVYSKDSGEVLLDGQPVDIDSPRAAQALGIGIIHQELNLMNHLSAAQNIFIGREPRGRLGLFIDEEAMRAETQRIFERMNLRLDPRTPVGELTVARQQMVEIAKALSFDSRVLIMDEPTAALNNEEVADLFRIIGQLKSQGVAVVYISHKMDELKRIADRVTVMRDGQYIATVPMAETPMDSLIAMMVGRRLTDVENEFPDTSGNEVVLEARGICRGTMVRNASFVLRKGEILGFAGLMGAGRTELARAVFGADRIDAGEVFVRGSKVSIRSPEDAVAHGIGYLSEDRKHFGLATGMDVETNIALPNMKRFLSMGMFIDQAAISAAGERYVKQLNIKTPSTQQQVRLLSGGNQQKIVIAKWLLRDCGVLFFDEPTRGIDVGAKAEIYRLLNALAEQGKAIVIISSELPEILRMSHRVLVMCEGRITGELAGREASQEKIMQLATRREAATAI
ncbi:D-xylose ABC transporter ATP-binding protein [Variovorax paradoxus]|uniref:D-xylose ABC transporter ATP-binding protein n=1 Tax=Variovorax paradoxus TaxID=34073 RepID=A0AA91DSQ9_VARPD|nr:sugar ABC transporter ATP-binding protein [Variovorax paradoxus]OAK66947.1 D-xylose ABC transporter ATP-binding protein [Variovorax paradoxus]